MFTKDVNDNISGVETILKSLYLGKCIWVSLTNNIYAGFNVLAQASSSACPVPSILTHRVCGYIYFVILCEG